MKLSRFAKFFHIVELEEPLEDRVHPSGVNRILKISFFLAFVLSNLLTFYIYGSAGNNFFMPTGLSTTRLVVVTFLLMFFYQQFDREKIVEMDKQYDFGFVFHEDLHGDKVIKKW